MKNTESIKKSPAKAKVNKTRSIATSTKPQASKAALVEKPVAPKTVAAKAEIASTQPTREQIAIRAYEIYLGRGATHGHEQQDWAQAEIELTAKLQAQRKN